jgi:hypothetical protein
MAYGRPARDPVIMVDLGLNKWQGDEKIEAQTIRASDCSGSSAACKKSRFRVIKQHMLSND